MDAGHATVSVFGGRLVSSGPIKWREPDDGRSIRSL